jgi:cellulose synthase/poly-beta-1,6-N-acetylglucosamine synthase-like glycosyltransferase/peptidoglycan/xylan/chitin deacetylase (PgdA/CDA1 family)
MWWGRGFVVITLLLLSVFASLFIEGFTKGAMQGEPAPEYPAYTDQEPVGGSILAGGPAPGPVPLPAKTIVLTFEDGPDPTWTPRVLDVLRHEHVRATFLMTGNQVLEHPDLVRQVLREGHEIGTHGYTGADYSAVPDSLQRYERSLSSLAVVNAAGVRTSLVRPADVSLPDRVTRHEHERLQRLTAMGYVVVLTDKDAEDWRRPGVTPIVNRSIPAHGQGAVVTLRDGGGDRSQTVAALRRYIPKMRERGYQFRTVTDVLGVSARAVESPAGTIEVLKSKVLVAVTRVAHGVSLTGAVILLLLAVLTVVRFAVVAMLARRHHRLGPVDNPRHQPPVSIVVPAANEAAVIAASVRSLAASDYPVVEVIVVDDGSTDETADIVEGLGLPNVRLVRQPRGGKSVAINNGIAHASHDVIIMVDSDTVFAPYTVANLVQPLADPDVGAVSGNVKVGNRRGLLGLWQHIEYVTLFSLDRRMLDYLDAMPIVPGAVSAFRREAITQAGGVSADTLAEDTDLTMALARAGWRIVYEQRAHAWTEAPASVAALARQRYRWSYGTLQAVWKHRGAMREHGRAGRLGRRGLAYLVLFQTLLPLAAPLVDVFALYELIFGSATLAIAFLVIFVLLHAAVASYAFRLDEEPRWPLWLLPTQQIVYRQLQYLVVLRTVTSALAGVWVGWQHMLHHGERRRATTVSSR